MDKEIKKRKVKGKGQLTIGNSSKYGDYTIKQFKELLKNMLEHNLLQLVIVNVGDRFQ